MRLTVAQYEVLDLMRDGWELHVSNETGNVSLCNDKETEPLKWSTFYALKCAGVIVRNLKISTADTEVWRLAKEHR